MKKYAIAFLICLMTCSAWARSTNVIVCQPGSATCTYNQAFSYEVSGTAVAYNYSYFAGSFTTTGAYSGVVRIGIQLIRVGTAPSNIHLYLYSDNGSADPQTQLASSTGWADSYNGASTSGDLQPGSISTSATWYYFDIPSTNLSNATRYHVVINKSYTDSSNLIKVYFKDNGTPTEVSNSGSSLPPTTNYDASFNILVRVITCN